MTTIDDRSMIEDNVRLPTSERTFYVPQQLLEVNELLKSINRRLEDCALEWQAEISRKQWKIFNSKVIGGTLSEQSLLTRTYFTEKNLDEAFQHLLSCNKIFSEYLKNFIDLLRGGKSTVNIKETCNAQHQCSNETENSQESCNDNTKPLEVSSSNRQPPNERRAIQSYIDNILTVQNSFTDTIKAKLDFDTKFLGFEAILHKATSTSTDTICLCQYCSNIIVNRATQGKNKRFKGPNANQRSRMVTKTKRLTRSRRTVSRKRKRERPSAVVGDAGDQPLLGTHE